MTRAWALETAMAPALLLTNALSEEGPTPGLVQGVLASVVLVRITCHSLVFSHCILK